AGAGRLPRGDSGGRGGGLFLRPGIKQPAGGEHGNDDGDADAEHHRQVLLPDGRDDQDQEEQAAGQGEEPFDVDAGQEAAHGGEGEGVRAAGPAGLPAAGADVGVVDADGEADDGPVQDLADHAGAGRPVTVPGGDDAQDAVDGDEGDPEGFGGPGVGHGQADA